MINLEYVIQINPDFHDDMIIFCSLYGSIIKITKIGNSFTSFHFKFNLLQNTLLLQTIQLFKKHPNIISITPNSQFNICK